MQSRRLYLLCLLTFLFLILLYEFNSINDSQPAKIPNVIAKEPAHKSNENKKEILNEPPKQEQPKTATFETIVVKSRSNCDCRKSKFLVIQKFEDHSIIHMSSEETKELELLYSIKNKELEEAVFTCDLFNSLRRGKAQKVISYSLYNNYTAFFYDKLKVNTVQMTKVYPEWRMRVYYDDSIDKSIICQIECQKDANNAYMDVADFCHINNVELKFDFSEKSKSIFNGDYIHAMVWRWFPLGDTFIDVFSSRDMDSYLLQREVDSVSVWLKSDKVGHIMRGEYIYSSKGLN